jgi:putative tricarboxylic transport membrane protein
MKVSDRITGLMLVILGGFVYWGGSKLPPVPGQQVGPDVFPMVVGAALVICGLLIAFGVGRTFEEDEKIVIDESGNTVDVQANAQALSKPQTRLDTFLSGGWKILVPPLALFFYYFASEKLGFWITAALMIFALAKSQGASLKASLALTVIAPAVVHLIFFKLLRVPLPLGFLKFPWA